VTSTAQLRDYSDPKGAFSLLKACLAVAGFLPEFGNGTHRGGLPSLLRRLGGGLDLSVLSAVPKGSGLGTSSILAATVLGTLNASLGLGWSTVDLYDRTLTVEQLLTTGGGWQDQAGALYPGVKLVTTDAGDRQTPRVLPIDPTLLETAGARGELLLYYTGITRLAKAILREIVRDMFLRRQHTQRVLAAIRANAHRAAAALQAQDRAGAVRAVQRSWRLNRALDAGTSPPAIDALIAACGADLAACKLLGAGGGGFMLLWATDPAAAERLRRKLTQRRAQPGSRFVDFSICHRGFEVSFT
jgi:galactokinase/mevalonate kinase-like predicted kinase